MSLFDSQFLSSPTANNSFSEHCACNFDCFDQQDISPHSDSVNDSTASYCLQEVTTSPSPTSSLQRNQGKRLQRSIYNGPDVFGKVLGPTADESILVGLQALMDMAGSLEFSTSNLHTISQENPINSINIGGDIDSREASATVTKSSASCQCCTKSVQEKNMTNSPEIMAQEATATVTNATRSKCQQSQTRVLPTSMTCYNPDSVVRSYDQIDANRIPCPNLKEQKLQMLGSRFECKLKSTDRPVPRVKSPPFVTQPTYSPNCPCSKFYHQTTTISMLEKPLPESPTRMPRATDGMIIFPIDKETASVGVYDPPPKTGNLEDNVEGTQKPVRPTRSNNVQTHTLPSKTVMDEHLETESVASQEKTSVACDCNICIPMSAGVSEPSSKIASPSKLFSLHGRNGRKPTFSESSPAETNIIQDEIENEAYLITRNKSCTCSLIQKGMIKADAACSCLKVNTSCQYYKSEITPIESRSTQCGRTNPRHISSSQVGTESGDFRPHKKKSVRILGGPYDCPNFSDTRYCVEPRLSMSRSVVPLLDGKDDLSKIGLDKSARICLEMGDSCFSSPMEVRYAITKITKFRDFSTFEVMRSTGKKPKCMPKVVEGVFVLKKEEKSL